MAATRKQLKKKKKQQMVIHRSPYPAPDIPTDISIPEFLLQADPDGVRGDKIILEDFDYQQHGDGGSAAPGSGPGGPRPAGGGGGGSAVTFAGFRERAALQAAVLRTKYGLKQGDVVALYGVNTVRWAVLCAAIMWAGGTFCAMNSLATSYELVRYLEIAQPKLVFADVDLLERVETAARELQQQQQQRQQNKQSPGQQQHSYHPQILDMTTLEQDVTKANNTITPITPVPLPGGKKNDNRKAPAAGIIFTSGTSSGRPKGVQLSHHCLVAQLLSGRSTNPAWCDSDSTEVFFPPFAHIYGLFAGVLLPAWVGCHEVLMPRFDFDKYVARCVEIRATVLRLVPATAARLVAAAASDGKLDLRCVKSVGSAGASLSAETVRGLRNVVDPEAAVLNGYGMSEGFIAMQCDASQGLAKPASVGRVMAGGAIRIVDDDGDDVTEVGVDGECLLQSPSLFMGYLNNEEETAEAFVIVPDSQGEGAGKWFRTGDILRIDGDGDLWMTGRKKELIKYKGNQVSPAELESVLLGHELVVDAGVCGLTRGSGNNSDGTEEVPAACIVLAQGDRGPGDNRTQKQQEEDKAARLARVQAYLDERVAPYKRLRGGIFAVRELPRGSTGKLLRRELPRIIADLQRRHSVRANL